MRTTHIILANWPTEVSLALAQAGSDDDLLIFHDPLQHGPLHDIDGGAAARVAFWEQIAPGGALKSFTSSEAATLRALRALRTALSAVVVWRGPNPAEHLLALRVASVLQDSSAELFDIVIPRLSRSLPAFSSSVNLLVPEEASRLLEARVPVRDAARRAAQWRRVCENPSTCFRQLKRGRILELGEDAYDDIIVSVFSDTWKNAPWVLAPVFSEFPFIDCAFMWRLRTLIARGVLEGRGRTTDGLCPVEVRRAG